MSEGYDNQTFEWTARPSFEDIAVEEIRIDQYTENFERNEDFITKILKLIDSDIKPVSVLNKNKKIGLIMIDGEIIQKIETENIKNEVPNLSQQIPDETKKQSGEKIEEKKFMENETRNISENKLSQNSDREASIIDKNDKENVDSKGTTSANKTNITKTDSNLSFPEIERAENGSDSKSFNHEKSDVINENTQNSLSIKNAESKTESKENNSELQLNDENPTTTLNSINNNIHEESIENGVTPNNDANTSREHLITEENENEKNKSENFSTEGNEPLKITFDEENKETIREETLTKMIEESGSKTDGMETPKKNLNDENEVNTVDSDNSNNNSFYSGEKNKELNSLNVENTEKQETEADNTTITKDEIDNTLTQSDKKEDVENLESIDSNNDNIKSESVIVIDDFAINNEEKTEKKENKSLNELSERSEEEKIFSPENQLNEMDSTFSEEHNMPFHEKNDDTVSNKSPTKFRNQRSKSFLSVSKKTLHIKRFLTDPLLKHAESVEVTFNKNLKDLYRSPENDERILNEAKEKDTEISQIIDDVESSNDGKENAEEAADMKNTETISSNENKTNEKDHIEISEEQNAKVLKLEKKKSLKMNGNRVLDDPMKPVIKNIPTDQIMSKIKGERKRLKYVNKALKERKYPWEEGKADDFGIFKVIHSDQPSRRSSKDDIINSLIINNKKPFLPKVTRKPLQKYRPPKQFTSHSSSPTNLPKIDLNKSAAIKSASHKGSNGIPKQNNQGYGKPSAKRYQTNQENIFMQNNWIEEKPTFKEKKKFRKNISSTIYNPAVIKLAIQDCIVSNFSRLPYSSKELDIVSDNARKDIKAAVRRYFPKKFSVSTTIKIYKNEKEYIEELSNDSLRKDRVTDYLFFNGDYYILGGVFATLKCDM